MNEKKAKLLANEIRRDIVKMVHAAGSGHPGGALGMTDLFTVLYGEYLKHDAKKPDLKTNDFVFLSNGHTCPVLYSTLANLGYFPKEELLTFRKLGSRLQGHPHNGSLPGVINSGGPLSQGISQAVGLAASLKRDLKRNRVYCFLGDGESQEGQVWEALLFAQNEKLDNLTIIVDKNNIQIDGNPEEVIGLKNLDEKFLAFNFNVIEIDGNNIEQIAIAYEKVSTLKGKPTVIIANTVPGKHVSFMEDKHAWHGKAPNDSELEIALKDLDKVEKEINEGKL